MKVHYRGKDWVMCKTLLDVRAEFLLPDFIQHIIVIICFWIQHENLENKN